MTDDDDLRAEVRELRSEVDALQHRLGRVESILDTETPPPETGGEDHPSTEASSDAADTDHDGVSSHCDARSDIPHAWWPRGKQLSLR